MGIVLSISVVLFENDPAELRALINNILETELQVRLYLVDNSSSDSLKAFCQKPQIEYIFNNKNFGYGAAHNIAIKKSQDLGIKYHLVMNPDIIVGLNVLEKIYGFMEKNLDVGQLMPKILYNDGEIQRLCKLLPTPFDLIGRRFFKNAAWAKKRNSAYELEGFNYDKMINTPSLSGCFMFFRNEVLEKVGGFDPRYFMYLEDYDLTRRVHMLSKTVFFPEVSIFHGFKKESYNNPILLRYHISSAVKYFTKWGWIFDKQRDLLNRSILEQI